MLHVFSVVSVVRKIHFAYLLLLLISLSSAVCGVNKNIGTGLPWQTSMLAEADRNTCIKLAVKFRTAPRLIETHFVARNILALVVKFRTAPLSIETHSVARNILTLAVKVGTAPLPIETHFVAVSVITSVVV